MVENVDVLERFPGLVLGATEEGRYEDLGAVATVDFGHVEGFGRADRELK